MRRGLKQQIEMVKSFIEKHKKWKWVIIIGLIIGFFVQVGVALLPIILATGGK